MDFQQLYENFLDETELLSRKIQGFEGVIQVIFSSSPDAIVSAAIFGKVFHDLQKPCVLTRYSAAKIEAINQRSRDSTILIDVPIDELKLQNQSIQLQFSNNGSGDSIIIDELGFRYPGEINLASIAYFICSPFAQSLNYIIQLPLISHYILGLGEYGGINQLLVEDALTGNVVSQKKHFIFHGISHFSICDSLTYTINPMLPGISGDPQKALELVTKSGIENQVKGERRKLLDLTTPEMRDLNSNLILHLSKISDYKEESLKFVRKRLFFEHEQGSLLSNPIDYALAIKDCFHREKLNLVLKILLGSRGRYLRELNELFENERQMVMSTFRFIEEHRNDVIELSSLRYLQADNEVVWYIATHTAALGLSHNLVPIDKPFAVVAKGPFDLATISLRSSKSHVDNLDELLMGLKNENLKIRFADRLSVEISMKPNMVEPVLLEINQLLKSEGI